MKLLVILPLLACASATPQYLWGSPVAAPWFAASQYHGQDGLGAASYGYTTHNQASAAFRDHFGRVIGRYSYVGADGKLNDVQYVADEGGFRVLANNLPEAPLATQAAAPVFNPAPLEPVKDTAEVAAAKAEFFRLYKEAEAAAAAAPERKKRQVFLTSPAIAAVPTFAKTTLKTQYYEPSKDAKTPAATTLITAKEAEHDVITPLGYQYQFAYPAPVAVKSAEVKTLPVYTAPAFSYVF